MIARCFIWILMLTASPTAAQPADPMAGRYRLSGVQDAASELVLTPDGRFRYYLIYGALDEMAEGAWRREGTQLSLTTQPKPVPPRFLLARAEQTSAPGLAVSVVDPDGDGVAGIDISIRLDDGSELEGFTQEDGWQAIIPPGRKPETISLAISIYGVTSPAFPVNIARANRLGFLLEPNDLGQADFRDLPLVPGDGYVELIRDGARLRYDRVE